MYESLEPPSTADALEKHFECFRIRRFISEEIPFVINIQYPITHELITGTCEILDTEAVRAKQRFSKAYFMLPGAVTLDTYIQFHQHTLMEMAGNLSGHTDARNLVDDADTTGIDAICQHVYSVVQDLLEFLETNFADYYNREAWIIPSYGTIQISYFQRRETKLQAVLLQHKVDAHLINLVVAPVRAFIENRTPNTVRYQTLAYLKELHDRIFSFSAKPKHAEDVLYGILLSLNFNCPDYCQYATNRIKDQLLKLYDDESRISHLYQELQTLRMKDTKHAPLHKDAPSLAQQVESWVTTELHIYERRVRIKLEQPGGVEYAEKITLSVPLVQFMYGWKLLKAVGIVFSTPQQELRAIKTLFRTERAGDISLNTLNKLSHEAPVDNTMAALEKIVRAILEAIQRDRRQYK